MKQIGVFLVIVIGVFIPVFLFGCSVMAVAVYGLQRMIFMAKLHHEEKNKSDYYPLFGYAKW
jgi:hypothetical protein